MFLFCLVFFEISQKRLKLLKKKIERNHCILLYKKAQMIEHRKNYILRDIGDFVKMSISTLPNFVYALEI